jgi:hypothetical protein
MRNPQEKAFTFARIRTGIIYKEKVMELKEQLAEKQAKLTRVTAACDQASAEATRLANQHQHMVEEHQIFSDAVTRHATERAEKLVVVEPKLIESVREEASLFSRRNQLRQAFNTKREQQLALSHRHEELDQRESELRADYAGANHLPGPEMLSAIEVIKQVREQGNEVAKQGNSLGDEMESLRPTITDLEERIRLMFQERKVLYDELNDLPAKELLASFPGKCHKKEPLEAAKRVADEKQAEADALQPEKAQLVREVAELKIVVAKESMLNGIVGALIKDVAIIADLVCKTTLPFAATGGGIFLPAVSCSASLAFKVRDWTSFLENDVLGSEKPEWERAVAIANILLDQIIKNPITSTVKAKVRLIGAQLKHAQDIHALKQKITEQTAIMQEAASTEEAPVEGGAAQPRAAMGAK